MTKLNSSKNDFERNNVDVFNLTLPNVGEMKRIRIGHDNWGLGADWHLKLVGSAAPTCPRLKPFPDPHPQCPTWFAVYVTSLRF